MKTRLPQISVAIAACLYAASAATEVQLLPAGEFAARDGRPGNGTMWKLTDADGRALAAKLNARTTPLVIDYEHQTLNAAGNGQPAPAAAWATKFEWRDGQGLFATDVQWTARAKQMIEAGEYKFISPVIVYDKAGVVRDVLNAALVNFPALEGMAEVAARLAAQLAPPEKEFVMNPLLAKLIAALGLQADATEETALTAAAALKARADQAEEFRTQLAALKADTTTTEAMKSLQTQVAALTAQLAARDLDGIVAAALAAGKLVPAQEKWARELGGKDLAALKTYIESAPAVAALGGSQTKGREAAGGADANALAARAQAYIAEQARSGRVVTAAEAVRHVQQAA